MSRAVTFVKSLWSHPANRGGRVRALARAAVWQAYKRLTGRHYDLRLANGLRLRCYPDSTAASSVIYFGGRQDYAEHAFLDRYLRPGDRVLDIGANVGTYTLALAGRVGPAGHVDAFEPCGRTLDRLRENVALNGLTNVTVHAFALGDVNGKVRFTTGLDVTNHIAAGGDEAGSAEVDCRRLDDVTAGPYSFAKMDVEGAEPLVFAGAPRLLASGDPPVWQLEFRGSERETLASPQEFAGWLHDRGYDLAVYDPEAGRLVWDEPAWRDAYNVFAVARARRGEVEARLKGD